MVFIKVGANHNEGIVISLQEVIKMPLKGNLLVI